MAVRTPGAGLPGRPRLLGPALVVVAVVLVLGGVALSLYTDLLWFREVGYTEVFTTVLQTRVLLFVVFGLLMALLIGANAFIAYRVRPPFRPMSLEQQNLERYRVAVEPYLRTVLLAGAGVFGLFAGLSAASRWQTWLLWRNGTSFGVQDEQFGRDVSYYAFTYPFQRFVLTFLITAIVLSIIVAAVVHYLFGGLRLQTAGDKVSPAARAHLSVLIGVVVLLKAFAYYLDRYGLAFSDRGFRQGPHYTDVNAVLPAKNILIGIAVICALLFFANIVVRNIVLPAGALALLVVSSVVIGGIYPAYTQQFRVKPNEIQREEPYIQRNIEATRAAYGIDDTEVVDYRAVQDADPEALEGQSARIDTARLLDPNELGRTYEQLQRLTFYFGVADTLDVDRYEIDGRTQDVVVAAREVDISNLPGDRQDWINQRLVYTHGNGLIAAPADRVDAEGRPLFEELEPNAPGSPIQLEQPRIYFGELSPEYSIVNTDQPEIDGPRDFGLTESAGDEEEPAVDGEDVENQATFSYDGDGGVQLSHFGRKLAYALKYREPNLLLSNAIRDDSRIMYVREPRERVEKVAPFLELDTDPYPAAVDGRVVWIVDGYTTSAGYPYSQRVNFGDVTVDSRSGGIPVQQQVNYIRNSVKATVDAYTGEVTLYQFGDDDPVLQSWNQAFGGDLLRPESEISDELRAHLRYPEDLFKVQRELLAQYHVEDASEFFTRDDFWEIPADPAEAINEIAGGVAATTGQTAAQEQQQAILQAAASGPRQPPFYSMLDFPGEGRAFRLSTNFTALNRPNLAAFASVSSEPDDYGTIRVLEVPRGDPPNGPGQVANQFLSEQVVADALFPFRQNRAEVTFGNLLTLPVGEGLLYVQPVFVRAQGGESFPTLQRVLVSYGNEVAAGTTLAESLADLFGADLPTDPVQPPGSDADPDTPPVTPTPAPTSSAGDLAAAIAEADAAYRAGEEALRRGDFAAYGQAQRQLRAALDRAAQLSGGGASPSPSPTG